MKFLWDVGFSVLARCCRCLAFGAELCCEAPHLTTLQRTAMTRRSWVCGSQSHAKTVLNMSEGSVVHYFCACSSAEIFADTGILGNWLVG